MSKRKPAASKRTQKRPGKVGKSGAALQSIFGGAAAAKNPEEARLHTIESLQRSAGSAAKAPPEQGGGCYVYGVIQAKEPLTFGKVGIGGQGDLVFTLHHGDIAAVVSKTSQFIYDPTRENALAHEHVI